MKFPSLLLPVFLLLAGPLTAQNQLPGISDAQIDSAPKLGKVIAYNRELGFMVTNANSLKGVKVGARLAAVQNGIVVAIGIVEEVNQNTSTLTLEHKGAYPSPVRRPKVRDYVIFFPPRTK